MISYPAPTPPPATRILVVDDLPANRNLLTRLMRRLGYSVLAVADGEQALAAVDRERPDLILLDVEMPKIDGLEVCRRLKRDPATRLVPIVLVTGLSGTEAYVEGIDAGADDFISKPFNLKELEARVRSLTRLKRYTDDLESAESVILSLGLTIEARDPSTQGHCERLARYASAFSASLGLGEDAQKALYRGAYLHDVGKVGIPDSVLLKAGPLTAAERALMEQHPIIGDRLCGELRSLADVRPIVRHHHERLDGSGYPDRLEGEAIPILAQIIGVIDVYDALTTERSYKAALSQTETFRELRAEVQKGWRNADFVEAFIALGLQGGLAPA